MEERGQYKIDHYQAVSFEGIQNMFNKCAIAKYAYIFAVQPLKDGAPSFCLACVRTAISSQRLRYFRGGNTLM